MPNLTVPHTGLQRELNSVLAASFPAMKERSQEQLALSGVIKNVGSVATSSVDYRDRVQSAVKTFYNPGYVMGHDEAKAQVIAELKAVMDKSEYCDEHLRCFDVQSNQAMKMAEEMKGEGEQSYMGWMRDNSAARHGSSVNEADNNALNAYYSGESLVAGHENKDFVAGAPAPVLSGELADTQFTNQREAAMERSAMNLEARAATSSAASKAYHR